MTTNKELDDVRLAFIKTLIRTWRNCTSNLDWHLSQLSDAKKSWPALYEKALAELD